MRGVRNKEKKKVHTMSEQECRVTKLQAQNAKLEKECELLRVRVFLAMQNGKMLFFNKKTTRNYEKN